MIWDLSFVVKTQSSLLQYGHWTQEDSEQLISMNQFNIILIRMAYRPPLTH